MSTEAKIVTLKDKDGQVIAPRTTTGAVSDFPSIDTTPTSNSSNLITSGGVKSVVDLKANLTHASQHAVGGSDLLTPQQINAMPVHPDIIEFGPSSTAGHGGILDFHFNGSQEDFTSRIAELASGVLDITASDVRINYQHVATTDRITKGTNDITAGSTHLQTDFIYLVYE